MAQTDSELRHRTRCIGYSILATLIPTPDDRYSGVYVFLRYAIQLGDRRDVIPEVSWQCIQIIFGEHCVRTFYYKDY